METKTLQLQVLLETIVHPDGVIKLTDHFEKFNKTCHVPFGRFYYSLYVK